MVFLEIESCLNKRPNDPNDNCELNQDLDETLGQFLQKMTDLLNIPNDVEYSVKLSWKDENEVLVKGILCYTKCDFNVIY